RTLGVGQPPPLPPTALARLEDRPDLDLEPGFLAHLSRERVLEALARGEEAAEKSPLRRTEAMAREEHPSLRIDAETDDPDEESRLRPVEDAPLPADGERDVEGREQAHAHRRTLGDGHHADAVRFRKRHLLQDPVPSP